MKPLLLCIPFIVVLSCASNGQETRTELAGRTLSPEPESSALGAPAVEAPVAETPSAVVPEPEAGAGFDPQSVTAEEKETTMDEMRGLIASINRVIRIKDYEGWISYLAEDFMAAINSPDYLAQLSETSPLLKSQNIILKTPQDYFNHVVVASRENVRVDASLDDIEFLSHTRVKAFTVNSRRQRLRLFEFVKAGNTWKIALPS